MLDRAGEDDKDDDDHQTGQGDNGSRSASSALDGNGEEGSRPPSAMSIGQPPRSKKRKRNPGTPTQRGHDFWSMVDKWFTARMQPGQLGTSWSSPGWTKYVLIYLKVPLLTRRCRYIEETLERDRAKFKSEANVNPYLDNFTSAGGDVGDNTGGGSAAGGLVAAIGSMVNILEHV